MTVPADDSMTTTLNSAFIEAVIVRCNLTNQDTSRIFESMRTTGLDFGPAAVHLGLVDPAVLEDIAARLNRASADGAGHEGVVEAAIRGIQGKALVIRQGRSRPTAALILAHDAHNPRSEKIRALRTELMLLNEAGRRGNVFALVSAGRGEGRSQLCAELAIAFAQLGRRTLLIDADLRHPRQHILFDADNHWGLAHTLATDEVPYFHSVDGLPDMTLLTAGEIPPNPLELVSHQRFSRLLTQLRRQYDFIVIDTPPVSDYADGLQVATVAQRVVVVGRSEATSFTGMKEMLRRLAFTESKILGAVVNHF